MPDATPLGPESFAALMARLEPFESRPHIAVGVSGGADSLALTLLMHDWATARGGAVLALTVDHRLRPEATHEAAQVAAWLAARGITHEALAWTDDKPTVGVQAAAREARHRLLAARCREAGILHLALAHHRDDQAETVLLRLGKGSGVDGLAAMAAVRETPDVRVLRPLLTIPAARLATTCEAYGQPWIDDPSNRSPRFTRVRLRDMAATLAAGGITPEGLAESARRAGRVRAALDDVTAAVLAQAAAVHAEGYAWIDPAFLWAASPEIGLRALARVLGVIGGAPYAPKLERLERLYAHLRGGGVGGRTLGGCRVLPRKGRLLVCREAEAAGESTPIEPGQTVWWDRRFRVWLEGTIGRGQVWVARLGEHGLSLIRSVEPSVTEGAGVPATVVPTLPALWDEDGVMAVPHLRYVRGGLAACPAVVSFVPPQTMAGPVFAVV